MSYVVFARKWRPQNFDQIIGQEHIATTLKNAIELDRVAHAYLFSGPRGTGKTSTARILAKALSCSSGPTSTPCNDCIACKEITSGTSLDCIEIDGASNRGIDEIRDLRENVKFAPIGGRFKIYIIDEVHMLTSEAFNALLKTLEEPPKHVKFIFATTRPHKLLPTIISRCQRFDFKRISAELIISKLKKIATEEKIDVSEEALFYIAKAAGGGMRDAESLLDQLVSAKKGKLVLNDVIAVLGIVDWELIGEASEAIKENNTAAALDIVARVFSGGKDITQFIDELIEHFRNLMVARLVLKEKEGGDEKLSELINLPKDHLAEVTRQCSGFSIEDALYIIQVLSNTKQLLKNSPLTRVPLELAMVRLTRRQSLVSVAQIIQRLSKLEEKISGESLCASPSETLQVKDEVGISGEYKAEKQAFAENPSAKTLFAETSPEETPLVEIPPEEAPLAEVLPEEAPPAETSSVGLEGADKFWPQLLERLRKIKMSAAIYLSNARPVKLEGRMLTIGFSKDAVFSKEALEKNHNREAIENILKEILNQDIKIILTLVESKTLSSFIPAKPDGERKPQEHEVIIERALDIFEGRITD